jgi:hypothetical protein
MFCKPIVGSVAGIALAAGSANAAVYFTFADPSTELEVRGETPALGGTGDLTYGEATITRPTIRFTVDATEEGGSITTFDAYLVWDLEFGPATVTGMTTTATVIGTFEFREEGTDDVILSGDVGEGYLFTMIGVGTVLTDISGGLNYEVGPALTAADPVVTDLQGEFDGVYTLTRLQFENNVPTFQGQDGQTYYSSFSANAAFTGTAERIPAPGAVVLSVLALGFAGFSRRR